MERLFENSSLYVKLYPCKNFRALKKVNKGKLGSFSIASHHRWCARVHFLNGKEPLLKQMTCDSRCPATCL